jgi:UDP-N-acetylmuramoyl-tripeptide--D-alanyl-D-alanine ligase
MVEAPALFSAAEAASLAGASLVGKAGALIGSVVVDSRKAGPGALFVALPGERTDGHDHISAAIEAGASVILARADRRSSVESMAAEALAAKEPGVAIVFAPEPLAALQALAREHRRRFPRLLRIGITGSSGKTTTKECAVAALGTSRSLVMNEGNLNSDIGLSLSMFNLRPEHELGVFEMGMNRRGEMAELASVYEPDLALITNVGTAHIGILGSRDAIALEKKQIFSRFDGSQAGFVPEDDDYRAFLKEGVRGEMLEFGPRSTKGFGGARDLGLEGYEVDWEGLRFRFPLAGRHNLRDGIAAMALAGRLGTPAEDVAEGLASVRPLFGRSEVIRGELTLVRDCYNANPDSMGAALGLCDDLDWAGRRIYALGSMLELGPESDAAHRALGARAGASRADALFFFGEEARAAFEEARATGFRGLIVFETDMDRLRASLASFARPGDLVLLKASRGMALWRAAEGLPGVGALDGAVAQHG